MNEKLGVCTTFPRQQLTAVASRIECGERLSGTTTSGSAANTRVQLVWGMPIDNALAEALSRAGNATLTDKCGRKRAVDPRQHIVAVIDLEAQIVEPGDIAIRIEDQVTKLEAIFGANLRCVCAFDLGASRTLIRSLIVPQEDSMLVSALIGSYRYRPFRKPSATASSGYNARKSRSGPGLITKTIYGGGVSLENCFGRTKLQPEGTYQNLISGDPASVENEVEADLAIPFRHHVHTAEPDVGVAAARNWIPAKAGENVADYPPLSAT
ncbi:hypothetical protein [Methylobacterium sp. D48H]